MTTESKKDNWLLNLWKHKIWGFILKSLFVLLIAYIVPIVNIWLYPQQDYIKLVVNLLIGILIVFYTELQILRSDHNKLNDKIIQDNNSANSELAKVISQIVIQNVENKIYRKLVSTNAIISNRDNKLAITARVLDDFPDESIYKTNGFDKTKSESIDLVRFLSYQNLLLTPKYLEYFFYRKDSVRKATRIVVLDKDQLDGKVCQATLIYLFLSARYGYETFIIPEHRYKSFIRTKCNNDEEKIKLIKGNPFMLKIFNGSIVYKGEYTDYQDNIANNGTVRSFEGEANWNFLESLKNNSIKIEPKSTGFAEYINSQVYTLNHRQIS